MKVCVYKKIQKKILQIEISMLTIVYKYKRQWSACPFLPVSTHLMWLVMVNT